MLDCDKCCGENKTVIMDRDSRVGVRKEGVRAPVVFNMSGKASLRR